MTRSSIGKALGAGIMVGILTAVLYAVVAVTLSAWEQESGRILPMSLLAAAGAILAVGGRSLLIRRGRK